VSADPRTLRQARTHLNLAAHHLEQAEAKLREAGLLRRSGTVLRLVRETTEALSDLSS
jgi:hypothetical protein